MLVVWFLLFAHAVTAQPDFGRSYLANLKVRITLVDLLILSPDLIILRTEFYCHRWDCLNKKLNFDDSLPPKDLYADFLHALLPSGPWHHVVNRVVEMCYEKRVKKYTNTCPGQALLHCTVDQLNENCPSESWVQNDGCTPLTSSSDVPYMFSQSRYSNLSDNLSVERRPSSFLKNYFSTKCCDIPQLFNDTLLSECGFNKLVLYHVHQVQRLWSMENEILGLRTVQKAPLVPGIDNRVQTAVLRDESKVQDPLDCCDMSEFIRPQWRAECGFAVSWNATERLTVADSAATAVTTTTSSPPSIQAHDVRVVPLSCEQNSCMFKKLNITDESGEIDLVAFTKLVDKLASDRPEWSKAHARVITKCLTKSVADYEADCEINRILKCTADALSESCPDMPETDPCKHSSAVPNGVICQIGNSKSKPKNRHQFCSLPDIFSGEVMASCNATWSWHLQYEPRPVITPRPHHKKWPSTISCKELTESTRCLMKKMGVLNKYDFIDHFMMKDRIRGFSTGEWAHFDVYNSVFQGVPLYREHCSSPKKLLNVLDSMLMTCPVSRRKNTEECRRILNQLGTPQNNPTNEKKNGIANHFQHIYLPDYISTQDRTQAENLNRVTLETSPLYDFGIFNNEDAPPVKTIDLKPKNRKPTVLLPVYQRTGQSFALNQLNNDGIYRG